jgi:hypothetical protein
VAVLSKLRSRKVRDSSALHLLVITLLGLPLITPLLHWTSVPCTHDGHLHHHRIAAIRYAWESGIRLARWLPDVAFGYGYPFFIFREGPPLYLALVPHLLGIPLPASVNLFYILSIFASGWFMYLWVRDVFGPRSAIVSAVAYMAAPYILIDALVRGNQPESMALALFPLILWAGRRFILRGNAASFLVGTLALALLALSHNISTLLFVPFLFVYLIGIGWARQIPWKSIGIRLLLMFGLGLALSAFYLGPALLELDEITITQSVSNRNNDFRFNFATLREIFAPVEPSDPSLLNPPLLLRLGWVPLLLSLLGVITLKWARSRERRGHIIFMALSAILLIFMALPAALAIWENLPLIEFVQFPWRFIGRAALPVAFLAGVPFAYLPAQTQNSKRTLTLAPFLTMAAVILLILEAVPHLYPHICPVEPNPTINTVHAYERNTGMVGVDPAGSYFPQSVKIRPDGSSLEEDYLTGRPPQRFDKSAIPQGASILDSDYDELSGRITIDSPTAFQARYLSFDYPGWKATVDGEPVGILASDPEGLITFPVPAGNHTLEVSWHMTPERGLLTAISVISAILIVLVFIGLYKKGPDSTKYAASSDGDGDISEKNKSGMSDTKTGGEYGSNPDPVSQRLDWFTIALLVAAGIFLLLFKLVLVDRELTPLHRAADPPVEVESGAAGGELRLDGYNLSSDNVSSGESFDIDLAWRVIEAPRAEYQSNVWLVGPAGLTWSDKETNRPRIYEGTASSQFWLPGQWVWDSREVEVLEGTPPGRYEIVLILFDKESLSPLTLIGPEGRALGPDAIIGEIEVIEPESLDVVEFQAKIEREISGLTLLGYNQDRQEAAPGEPVLLTLFWKKGQEDQALNDELDLVLLNDSGETVQKWMVYPLRSDFPPDSWLTDQPLRGQHVIQLEPDLNPGTHTFQINGVELGEIEIGELERIFDEPPTNAPVHANFSELAELVGLSIGPAADDPSNQTEVTLLWRGLSQMPISYRVFVHLIDDLGDIVAQSDGIPAGWTRPTTGWLPGEFVVDPHVLDTSLINNDRRLSLRIGLYDPANGIRIELSGEDSVLYELSEQDTD